MMIRPTLLAAMLLSAAPAGAQHYNTVHDTRCDNVTGAGDAGVRGCYWTLATAADDRRRQLLVAIAAVLTPAEARALTGAETRWTAYREAFCAAEHDLFDGGTAGLSADPTCRLALTEHHLAELNDGFGWRIAKVGR